MTNQVKFIRRSKTQEEQRNIELFYSNPDTKSSNPNNNTITHANENSNKANTYSLEENQT